MAVTVADFRTRFEEFEDATAYPDARIQIMLDESALQVNEDRWGRFYDLGVLYLTAHELKLDKDSADSEGNVEAAGPVRHQMAGEVAYTRAVSDTSVSSGDARLSSTAYGLKYLELRKLIRPVGFFVSGVPQSFNGFTL